MMSFDGLDNACKGLLLSTVQILDAVKLHYVVAGGWVPLLSEPRHPSLTHPGTRDVDILLMDDLTAIQNAANALMASKFRPSAKHEFQLLRDARVGSRDFVFNVDLMHPYEAEHQPEMFNDIIDLGVNDAYDPRGSRFAKSIGFRSASIVYEQKLFSDIEIAGIDLDGVSLTHRIPLLTVPAFILSKCESVSVKKRTRDAFDIYFVLSGIDGHKYADSIITLAQKFPQVRNQLEKLLEFLRCNGGTFDKNVALHARMPINTAAAEVLAMLTDNGQT